MALPVWNVYYHSINGRYIGKHNVLNHTGVVQDIMRATKECSTKEEFGERLRSSLMYYYWSKAEWEISIIPWCGGKDCKSIKVDVYDQVMMNWEIFLEFVWSERKNIRTQNK